jgi:mRNA-degrading endonuclease RelE of RelBE toxin-antitoxin system
MYVLKFSEDGLADVKALPKNVKNSLKKELQKRLAVDPYGCSSELVEPLRGWRSFHWKSYQLIFKVYEGLKAIAIVGVGRHSSEPRRDIYRRLEVLAAEGKLAARILHLLRGFSSGKQGG